MTEDVPDLFGGRMAAGLRVERVVRRPHETRVFLVGGGGRSGGLQMRFEHDARAWWTWHPLDDEDLYAFDLEPSQRSAVVAAVEVVVGRDVEAVRALLDEGAGPAEEFWEWVEGIELAVPPGPFEDWEVDALRTDDGSLDVHVDMWGIEEGEAVPLDETLRMRLAPGADGGWMARLEDLHVL